MHACVLSCCSLVLLFENPWTVARQASLSTGFSRQNTGVGCHFLLQCMKVKSEREVAQSCPTLSGPMDYSLPGSSVHGISQARVLEWGAIAFSTYGNYIHLVHGIPALPPTHCVTLGKLLTFFEFQLLLLLNLGNNMCIIVLLNQFHSLSTSPELCVISNRPTICRLKRHIYNQSFCSYFHILISV